MIRVEAWWQRPCPSTTYPSGPSPSRMPPHIANVVKQAGDEDVREIAGEVGVSSARPS